MITYFSLAGKQFFAKEGDIIHSPHVFGEVGDTVMASEVLGVDGEFSNLEGWQVRLKIVKQGKGKKRRVVKFISQKRHKRWRGFRTPYTGLEVVEIIKPGA